MIIVNKCFEVTDDESASHSRKGFSMRYKIYWGLDRFLDRMIGDSVSLRRKTLDSAFLYACKNHYPGATHFEIWQEVGNDMEVFKIRGETLCQV